MIISLYTLILKQDKIHLEMENYLHLSYPFTLIELIIKKHHLFAEFPVICIGTCFRKRLCIFLGYCMLSLFEVDDLFCISNLQILYTYQ